VPGIIPVADVRSADQSTGKLRTNDRPKRKRLRTGRRPDRRVSIPAVFDRQSLTGGVRICRQDGSNRRRRRRRRRRAR
jgi:hypothetical protein